MGAGTSQRALVVGVGNDMRGDDAAGLWVARRMGRYEGVDVLESDGDGAELVEAWSGAELVVVADASVSGAAPGTVERFDATASPLPAGLSFASTHMLGLAEAIELARVLRRLPRRLVVVTVEGASFAPRKTLSPEAARGVDEAVRVVCDEIGLGRAADRDG